MTKQELLNLAHAKTQEKETLIKVNMNKGFYFTTYKDGDDIKSFYAGKIMYTPIHDEYPDYRVITEAEKEEYSNKQREAFEAEKMAREAKINKR